MGTTYYAQSSAANINAAALWNTAANGSGSTLTWPPAADDVLDANGKTTLAINVDVTCGQLQTLNGGGFTVSLASTRNITANLLAGTTACLVTSGNTATLTVTGNITGGSASGAYGLNIGVTANGKVAIVGDVTGGSFAGNVTTASYGLYSGAGASNPVITGKVAGGTAAAGVGLQTVATDSVTVNGAMLGGSGATAYGVAMLGGGYLIVGTGGSLAFSAQWVAPFSSARVKWLAGTGAGATITMQDGTPTAQVFTVGGGSGGMILSRVQTGY